MNASNEVAAMRLALEALHYCEALNRSVEQQKMQAITALKEAIAKQEQCDCKEPSQCWEPCGELGKSEAHAKVYQQEHDEPVCHICKGTGEMDSGGTYPWGWAINIPCECTAPQPKQEQGEPVCRMRLGQDSVTWYDDEGNVTMHVDSSNKVTTHPQPKQEQGEPVAEISRDGVLGVDFIDIERALKLPNGTKLYTTPPQQRPSRSDIKPLTDEQCTWRQNEDPNMPDTWEADCGAMWTFTEGGPKDNDMKFCPNCGKPTIEAAHGIKE